jgi:muramidase (phage lysozyme)
MTRDELLTLSREPNVRAMLDAIAACEGTAGPDGYRTLFGGSLFDSFDAHPGKLITATMRGRPIASSAAGRYQFLGRTWKGLVAQYGFPSFEPQWQDAGAVALIAGRGALADVRAGRLGTAVEKLKNEWASLPGSPYGQPTKAADFVERAYLQAGGRLDAGAPIEARTFPPPPPPPTEIQPTQAVAAPSDDLEPIQPAAATVAAQPEPRMLPAVVAALIPSLIAHIPDLARLFSDGPKTERNAAIAQRVAEVVVAATAAPNLQGAVEAMERNPEVVAKAREAVKAAWFDIVPADGGGIEGARAAAAAATSGTDWRAIGYGAVLGLLAIMVVGGGGAMMWALIRDPLTTPEQRGMLIGAIVSIVTVPLAFFFGSSVSSRAKDSALVNELGRRP